MPVSRAGKRITLVACIGADGSHRKPMIIIARNTVNPDLFLLGRTDAKAVIRHQPKGVIHIKIFHAWMAEVLLLNNRSAHAGETFGVRTSPTHFSRATGACSGSQKTSRFCIN